MIRKKKAEELGVPECSLDLNFTERIISCYTYSDAFNDLKKLVRDYVEEMNISFRTPIIPDDYMNESLENLCMYLKEPPPMGSLIDVGTKQFKVIEIRYVSPPKVIVRLDWP